MTAKPFRVGERVVSVRDLEGSDAAIVIGYEENDRGFVLVTFADGVPRALPGQSLCRQTDRKDAPGRPIGQGTIWQESANRAEYFQRMAEEDPSPKKEQKC